MLTSFLVGGFKSIQSDVTVHLSPLTVLVGANSSGKSSLLQAFLLLSQSAQLPSSDLVLDFNGLFENLGTLQEVQSRPRTENLRIACGFLVPEARRRLVHSYDPAVAPRSAVYRVSVSTVDEAPGRPARVDDFEIKVRDASSSDSRLVAHRRRGGTPPTPHLPNAGNRPTLLASQQYRVAIEPTPASTSSSATTSPGDTSTPTGIELAGPLPVAIWRAFDSTARATEMALRDLLLLPPSLPSARLRNITENVSKLALDFWAEPEVESMLGPRPVSIDEARRSLATIRPIIRTRARSMVGEYIQKIQRQGPAKWAFERQPLPPLFASAIDELRERLSTVYYLGPLRAAPRPLFAATAGASQKSVGREGEFTAAVLHRYADERVSFTMDGQIVEETLRSAVQRWMRFLELHSGATAHHYGRLGHDLIVEDSVAGELDLTQVGVGVSQALPVIVQCLVAPPNSVIVLEQPELHLHPRVQARLTQFLLSVSRASRTILCETHSEYLVSRLRIGTGRKEIRYREDFRLYFTSRRAGATRVEEVPVQGKGNLTRWPEGFFEQSAEDASELLQVQLEQ